MNLRPEVTVAALVARDGQFLMIEERIGQRIVLNQPAGHVEDRETLLQAVIRETREESAWLFAPEALVGTYLWRNPRTGISTLRFAFCGPVSDHRAEQPLDQGILRALWMTPEQIASRSGALRSPVVQRCIDDYLAGQRHPLESVACLDIEAAVQLRAVGI